MFDSKGNPVSGTASVGVEGEVLNFLPAADLQPNSTYTMVISNVLDLAGNRAVGDPSFATVATLRTIGPTITNLPNLLISQKPLAGSTVQVIATLNTTEAGASVNFSQDFTPIGTATNRPVTASVQLPQSGSTTVRAVAFDKYGTEGQSASLQITVEPGTPPTVQITRVSPPSGPVPSGSNLVVTTLATAESAVAQISTIVGGAATGSLVVSNFSVVPLPATNTAVLNAQGPVPPTAIAGQLVVVSAQATDNAGLSKKADNRRSRCLSATALSPSVAIISPGTNALPWRSGQRRSTLEVQVSPDNSSNVNLCPCHHRNDFHQPVRGRCSSFPTRTSRTNVFIVSMFKLSA